VNNSNILIGILTDGDVRRRFSSSTINQHVYDLLVHLPSQISKDFLISDITNLFSVKGLAGVIIAYNGYPVGIVHIDDLHRDNF